MAIRKLLLLIVTFASALAVVTTTLMLASVPVYGAVAHEYKISIAGPCPSCEPPEFFGQPWGLAFGGEGDLYVADPGARYIDVFESNEGFATQFARRIEAAEAPGHFGRSVAVNSAAGDVYIGDSEVEGVYAFNALDENWLLRSLSGFGYVYAAVDNSTKPPGEDPHAGDVYILTSFELVAVIKPRGEHEEGEFLEFLEAPGAFGGPNGADGLAVDATTGSLYVAGPSGAGNGVVDVYNNKGELQEALSPKGAETPAKSLGKPVAVGIDEASGEVYIIDSEHKVVDEFNASGKYLGQIAEAAPGKPFVEPLGVMVSSAGDVYVSDAGTKVVDVFGPDFIGPDVVTKPPSNVERTTATLNGTVNPEGERTTYYFEYGPCATPSTCVTSAYPLKAPEPEGVVGEANETKPVDVHAPVEGLTAGATYHVRLIASNSTVHRAAGEEVVFKTLGPPILTEESFSEIGVNSATVSAKVYPQGPLGEQLAATYWVEYGIGSISEHKAPEKPESLAPGNGPVSAVALLSNLEVDTEYHFRVVAEDAGGTTQGPEQMFHTSPPTVSTLADGRAYEMVTPVANQNANVYAPSIYFGNLSEAEGVITNRPFQASEDGDAVAYVGQPTSGGNGSEGVSLGNEYLATRGVAGEWTQHNIQPAGYRNAAYQAFSSGLSVGFLGSTEVLSASSPEGVRGFRGLYSHPLSSRSYQPLFTKDPPNRSEPEYGTAGHNNEGELLYAGASSDLGHLLFEADDALLEGEGKLEKELNDIVKQEVEERRKLEGEATKLKEEGETALALSKEELAKSKDHNNLYDSVNGRLRLVNVLPNGTPDPDATFGAPRTTDEAFPDLSHVISRDGSRIFWTSTETFVSGGRRFERPKALYVREDGTKTVMVSEGARFETSTPDGNYVFYTDEAGMLWRFDVQDETLVKLAGAGADVQGVIGINGEGEDGAYVYFVADGVLTGKNTEGNAPEGGRPNLYLLHSNSKEYEKPTFIVTLEPADNEEIPPFVSLQGGGDWQPGLGNRTAEVAADGSSVVFMSRRSLTGYPNVGSVEGHPVALSDVYVYDVQTRRLSCASCNPSGEPPSITDFTVGHEAAAFVPISHSPTYQPRLVSADGNRVFFDSEEPLVPWDNNGRQDVYEWERDGAGSCRESRGCLYLLSGGASTSASWLLDSSKSGDDVFIITRAQLVPQDQNDNFDVYDVRVGGMQPLSPTLCEGTACQGVPSAPPIFETPASGTASGVGNFAPKPPVKHLTRAQKLAKALKACRAKRDKHRRAGCEAQARKRYGPRLKAKRRVRRGR